MVLLQTKKGAIEATSTYVDKKLCADDAEITMPDIEFALATLTTAGDMEVPMAGIVNSMEVGVTTPGFSKNLAKLGQPEIHELVVNAVQQVIGVDGAIKHEQVKYTITAWGKKSPGGTVKQGEAGSQAYALSVVSYKMAVGGDVVHDINKMTGKCVIDGVDYGKKIKSLL